MGRGWGLGCRFGMGWSPRGSRRGGLQGLWGVQVLAVAVAGFDIVGDVAEGSSAEAVVDRDADPAEAVHVVDDDDEDVGEALALDNVVDPRDLSDSQDS